MSTRGCVAIKQGKGFRGVYNHSDSYPTELGKEVANYLKDKDLQKFASDLMRFDDWRDFLNGGVCPYCGSIGLGQPHSFSGDLLFREEITEKYSDPEKKFHKHEFENGNRNEIRANITNRYQKTEALFIEWVYIVDPDTATIRILTSCRAKGEHQEKAANGNTWMQANYKWVEVSTVNIGPDYIHDWDKIEKLGEAKKEEMYHKYDSK